MQSPHFLNTKFPASSYLLRLYSLVCVGPGRKPEDRFSHNEAHLKTLLMALLMSTHNLCFCGENYRENCNYSVCFFCFQTSSYTFSEHFLITEVNSLTTISQHFSDGARSFSICFFTMASNAMSGVNRPDLIK